MMVHQSPGNLRHNRDEHIRAKFPCLTCDFQADSMPSLRKHQLEKHNQTGAVPKSTLLNCDQCNYKTKTENNLEVHRSLKHSQSMKCNLCEFECGTESELMVHEEELHKKSKFSCMECHNTFQSAKRLEEHMQYKHSEISWYPCDFCGLRLSNFNDLDVHIENSHNTSSNNLKSRKNTDIRDVRKKKPCNPADPSHNRSCCDRKPRYENTSQNSSIKEQKAPCRFWNKDGYCPYEESCRFAHVETCRFQEFLSLLANSSTSEIMTRNPVF